MNENDHDPEVMCLAHEELKEQRMSTKRIFSVL